MGEKSDGARQRESGLAGGWMEGGMESGADPIDETGGWVERGMERGVDETGKTGEWVEGWRVERTTGDIRK